MVDKKLSFWQLINNYDKIEIPIIQRDYAQGRDTKEVKNLREKFIYDFLLESLLKSQPIELDFVYGSILKEQTEEKTRKLFIPLDGQQRLTTLFLLHYYIAIKENSIDKIKSQLSRFTYETRPSAHDFCIKLLDFNEVKNLKNIKEEIKDSVWFNFEWKEDPTVSGMLNMLDTFAKHEGLNNHEELLLPKLLDNDNRFISFYFTKLEEFGLTENLYIRMNARGKSLNDFENFKSEFFKIIQYDDELLETVKDKIEYQWVENLWEYRADKSFLIDVPFLNFVSFITEMLYYKNAEFRSSESYADDFLDFKLLKEIYTDEESLKFLIFSLDYVKTLSSYEEPFMWGKDKDSIKTILSKLIKGRKDTNEFFVIYASLQYSYQEKKPGNLMDYLRVIRNLISNTPDNSRREWPRLIPSTESLISDENVYNLLSENTEANTLLGFSKEQRKEEIYKSKIFLSFPALKKDFFDIEDHSSFEGNITNILRSTFADSEDDFSDLLDNQYTAESFQSLLGIFKAYQEIAKKDFDLIWGNLIDSSLYEQTYDERLVSPENYQKHPALLYLAKMYASQKDNLDIFIEKFQKNYIKTLGEKYSDFGKIRDVKQQLKLYYIIQQRIYKTDPISFFKNGNFNFGWLRKEKGYKSHFVNGVEGSSYFENSNPIFQLYNSQFRYNSGINFLNTLDIEIIGGKKRNPFQLIKEWAEK